MSGGPTPISSHLTLLPYTCSARMGAENLSGPGVAVTTPDRGQHLCGGAVVADGTRPRSSWPIPAEVRFWSKFEVSDDDGCWLWTDWVTKTGYGLFSVDRKTTRAHRFAYTLLVGPIPDGMELDHLCHTHSQPPCAGGDTCIHRRCVNPAHLEPVTALENNRRIPRPTHCREGHPLSGDNLRIAKSGYRICRICNRAEKRRYRAARKEAS